ncbi:MAG TPA: hypothetical protein VGZ73_17850 [Bryobacteraceae bacterium]|jgi:hypothetical protein|nr:hypothetical protein [Bryobacteraceae bacterium]
MDLTSQQSPNSRTIYRRVDRRYPIDAELEYKLIYERNVFETGQGKTINVSSSGILFESERALPPGMEIELSIAWPARLGDAVRLKLCVSGRTVRAQGKCTAVLIQRHIFRTRGTREGDVSPPLND